MPRAICLSELAAEADVDIDEALVRLWDAGFDEINDPSDKIPRRKLDSARKALGIPTLKELKSIEFWCRALAMDRPEICKILNENAIKISKASSTVPSGGVSVLKKRLGNTSQSQSLEVVTEDQCSTSEEEYEPVKWDPPGHEREIGYLSEEEVLGIHQILVEDYRDKNDPIDPPGIRDDHLFKSAVFRQHTGIGNKMKYTTVESVGAALLHSIILDHPFHNGNKRTALVSLLVFLDKNGFLVTCKEEELFKLVLQIAQHRVVEMRGKEDADREVLEIAYRIRKISRLKDLSNHPLQWRQLKAILREYGCEFECPTVGNRINVTRYRKKILGFRARVGSTQVTYRGDGTDTTVQVIKTIRRDLKLDEKHGIDSHRFYRTQETAPSVFVTKYRQTLNRLAKL